MSRSPEISRLRLAEGFCEVNLQLIDHELKNGRILVDGNSLAWKLSSLKLHEMHTNYFVEDVAGYTNYTSDLFKSFADCNLQVILVIQNGLKDSVPAGDSPTDSGDEDEIQKMVSTDVPLPPVPSKIVRSVAKALKVKVADCGRRIYRYVGELSSVLKCPILTDDGAFLCQVPWPGMIPLDSLKGATSDGVVKCKIFKPATSFEMVRGADGQIMAMAAEMRESKTFSPTCVIPWNFATNDSGLGLIDFLSRSQPAGDAAAKRVLKQINDKLAPKNYPSKPKRLPSCKWDERRLAGILDYLCAKRHWPAYIHMANLVDESDRKLVSDLALSGTIDLMLNESDYPIGSAITDLCDCPMHQRVRAASWVFFWEGHMMRIAANTEPIDPSHPAVYARADEQTRKQVSLSYPLACQGIDCSLESFNDHLRLYKVDRSDPIVQEFFMVKILVDAVIHKSRNLTLAPSFKLAALSSFIYYQGRTSKFLKEFRTQLASAIDQHGYQLKTPLRRVDRENRDSIRMIGNLADFISAFNHFNPITGYPIARVQPKNWLNWCLICNLIEDPSIMGDEIPDEMSSPFKFLRGNIFL